ncbi:hypothetical protein J6590_046419 [Homalodisca vitripennis]|nr:hypothetical protein J6590_046419 [Homalodisca vitripennis]
MLTSSTSNRTPSDTLITRNVICASNLQICPPPIACVGSDIYNTIDELRPLPQHGMLGSPLLPWREGDFGHGSRQITPSGPVTEYLRLYRELTFTFASCKSQDESTCAFPKPVKRVSPVWQQYLRNTGTKLDIGTKPICNLMPNKSIDYNKEELLHPRAPRSWAIAMSSISVQSNCGVFLALELQLCRSNSLAAIRQIWTSTGVPLTSLLLQIFVVRSSY